MVNNKPKQYPQTVHGAVDDDTYQKLKDLSKATGQTLSEIIRRTITVNVNQPENIEMINWYRTLTPEERKNRGMR